MFFRILFLLFATFMVWAIYAADMGQENMVFLKVKALPYGDKMGHFFLMGTLGLLANLALGYRSFALGNNSVWLGSFLVLAVVVAEEFSQIYLPSRSFDVGDLAADLAGIVLLSWLGYRYLYVPMNREMA